MSVVERVARAIYESHKLVRPWDDEKAQRVWGRSCRDSAKAAIKVLRAKKKRKPAALREGRG